MGSVSVVYHLSPDWPENHIRIFFLFSWSNKKQAGLLTTVI
jgi:hypothetical protein